MSLNVSNVRGTFSRNSSNSSVKGSNQPNSVSDSTDIGSLVERHRSLVDLLFPFKVAWNACLYIARWENYPLTVTVALALSVLFYYPSLFLSILTLLSIVTMAVGKYYSQTKNSSILKTRDSPSVNKLDQDLQTLHCVHKEQKNSRLILLDYKQIIQNIEGYFLILTKCLDYLYGIVLWKSPEVSLCVTVLLCLCLVLFCTVYLRVIASFTPILVLCLNRHFLSRTVELWKRGGLFIYSLFRVKPKPPAVINSPTSAAEGEQPSDEAVTVNGELEEEGGREDLRHSNESTEVGSSASSVSQGDPDKSNTNATSRDSSRPSAPSNALPTCAICNSSFTIIKRKHKCTNCGLFFCGSCSVKVKRTLFGATAPAAYEESVRVCTACKVILETRLEELNPSRTTSVN